MHSAANMAFMMYSGLTHGAVTAIHTHGSEAQKAAYLPAMVACRWTGTMNLTEPHAGTDLGLLRTRAEPQPDGSYRSPARRSSSPPATTTSPRTSSTSSSPAPRRARRRQGHLALHRAEIPPQPRRQPRRPQRARRRQARGEDGHPRQRHLRDGLRRRHRLAARRAENAGLKAMFTMMNEARAQVGMQGLAQAAGAYQLAAAYARERLQGRAIPPPRTPPPPPTRSSSTPTSAARSSTRRPSSRAPAPSSSGRPP